MANTTPIFVGTPKNPQVRISVANTGRDGSGTLGTVVTAGSSGDFYKGVHVCAEVATTADVVRIFIQDGGSGNNELIKELIIPAITPSTTIEAATADWFPPGGIVLAASSKLLASTDQGKTYSVSLQGGGQY